MMKKNKSVPVSFNRRQVAHFSLIPTKSISSTPLQPVSMTESTEMHSNLNYFHVQQNLLATIEKRSRHPSPDPLHLV